MNNISIGEFFQSIEEVLKLIFDSIRTENLPQLNSAELIITKISAQAKSYQLYDNGCNDTTRKDVGGRIDKITVNLSRLVNIFKSKIDKHILFSDKALRELEYLIGTIKHLSRCLKDVAVTKNDVLAKYIIDTANALENTSTNFAQEHEERLTSGICQPQSSAVFIDLLNTLKENSYHFKEMGRQISCFR
ncbi:MAG: hypothetical protein HZA49_07915 [Planctomycetes bacterium]|nr:hypothetical protein [Planctomycetota bacterium]